MCYWDQWTQPILPFSLHHHQVVMGKDENPVGHLFGTKELKSQRLSYSLVRSFVWFYYYHLYSIAQLCPTLCSPWTVACQALLFMEFSRQEHWSGWPYSAPGDLPDPGIEPICLVSFALAGGFFTTSAACKAPHIFRWDTLTFILYISLLK